MSMGQCGTIVRVPDGRIGTVVYNGLDGIGIKWGEHDVTADDISGSGCSLIGIDDGPIPPNYEWHPQAMLREPYDNANRLECVGDESRCKIIKEGDEQQ